MPKIKLVYDLEKNEDVIYYNRANKASDMSNALFEMSLLRDKIIEQLSNENSSEDFHNGSLIVLNSIDNIILKYDINFNSLFYLEEKQLIVENTEQVVELKNGKGKIKNKL